MRFNREELIAMMHGIELQMAHLRITIITSDTAEKIARRISHLSVLKDKLQNEIKHSGHIIANSTSRSKGITEGQTYQKFSWTSVGVKIRNDHGSLIMVPRRWFNRMDGEKF